MKFDKEYHKQYWHKRRKKIIDYLGGKCIKCGSKEKLEIDHINANEKVCNVKDNLTFKTMKEEIDKCQVLCYDCHKEKSISERKPFIHGSRYGWQKKHCKCNDCQSTKIIQEKERNLKRRKLPGVAELADALDSRSSAFGRGGSTPSSGTNLK